MALGKICFFWTIVCILTVIAGNTEAKAARPVKVTVYYESLCPDSGRFFAEQLQPTYEVIPSYMKVELVPYGNARYKFQGGKYVFTCQHGAEECYGNIAQTCYTYFVNDTISRIKFINCAFNSPSQEKSLDLCIQDSTLKYKVKKCLEGSLGNNLEYQMAKKTEALNPPHTFIPWITLNGKGSRDFNLKAIEDLLSAVCADIKGQKPDQCIKNKWNIFKKFRKNYL